MPVGFHLPRFSLPFRILTEWPVVPCPSGSAASASPQPDSVRLPASFFGPSLFEDGSSSSGPWFSRSILLYILDKRKLWPFGTLLLGPETMVTSVRSVVASSQLGLCSDSLTETERFCPLCDSQRYSEGFASATSKVPRSYWCRCFCFLRRVATVECLCSTHHSHSHQLTMSWWPWHPSLAWSDCSWAAHYSFDWSWFYDDTGLEFDHLTSQKCLEITWIAQLFYCSIIYTSASPWESHLTGLSSIIPTPWSIPGSSRLVQPFSMSYWSAWGFLYASKDLNWSFQLHLLNSKSCPG